MPKLAGRGKMPDLASYDLAPPVQLVPLPDQGVNNSNVGVRTGGGDYIWKSYTAYEDASAIAYEHDLLHWLAARQLSFAVPAPIPMRDGTMIRCDDGRWAALAVWLPGTRFDPSHLDQVEWFGAAVGELLCALQSCPLGARPGRSLIGSLFAYPPASRNPLTITPTQLDLPDTPAYREQLAWWRTEAADLQRLVDERSPTLPCQVCHNDMAPGNVLVEADRVSAILDFEFATLAPRALDVAMGLRMIMRVWEQPEPWAVVRLFCRGYTQWLPLLEREIRAIPWLIRLRGAITVLWWLGRPDGPHDPQIVLERIAYLRAYCRWLESRETLFVATLLQEACRARKEARSLSERGVAR
jgi:Ser/Thr protein kinase RdoA (MazF antagonist)